MALNGFLEFFQKGKVGLFLCKTIHKYHIFTLNFRLLGQRSPLPREQLDILYTNKLRPVCNPGLIFGKLCGCPKGRI